MNHLRSWRHESPEMRDKVPYVRNGKCFVSIVAGNAPGQFEFMADHETDPTTEWFVEASLDELMELRRLRAARDEYFELCARLKARESEPLDFLP